MVIIAIIVALNEGNLATLGISLALAVMLHNLVGLLSGYWLPRILAWMIESAEPWRSRWGCRILDMGVALAVKYFSAAAALPGALFSIWHNLTGSMLAGYWSRRDS